MFPKLFKDACSDYPLPTRAHTHTRVPFGYWALMHELSAGQSAIVGEQYINSDGGMLVADYFPGLLDMWHEDMECPVRRYSPMA